jgi:hypothetical protein
MLDYIILMTIVGVVAIAASIYYMRKGGYDINDKRKDAH